jgi:hypothetical protein
MAAARQRRQPQACIDEIVEQAMAAAAVRAGRQRRHDACTLLTEVDRQRRRWPEQPARASLAPDLRAYQSAMAGIEIMAMEQFIVCR